MRLRFFILLVMILIVGCDSQHSLEKHLQEYQQRMANVLGAASQSTLTISLPPYPSIKDLEQNIPVTTIKLFEFYNLKHCQLYTLIAERNTTLGNVQLPSTRYIYERRLVDALEACRLTTSESKLVQQLEKWQQTKTQQLPMVWADLIQRSNESKQVFSANYALVEGDQQDGLIQTKTSLTYLLEISQNQQVSSVELEQHLKSLLNNPLPAKLWLSQLTLTKHLNRSTQWLRQRTNKLQCASKNNESEYLTNVFQQFFINKIQPIASQINYYQYQLSPIFEKLTNHPHLSLSFKTYITHFNQQGFQNYQLAMQQHIQFWQNFFKRCNIKHSKH